MRPEVEITVQHLETATGEILAKRTHYIDADDLGAHTVAHALIDVFNQPVPSTITSRGYPRAVSVRVEAAFDDCVQNAISCDRWVR